MISQERSSTCQTVCDKETRRGNGDIEEAKMEEKAEPAVGDQNAKVLNNVKKYDNLSNLSNQDESEIQSNTGKPQSELQSSSQ